MREGRIPLYKYGNCIQDTDIRAYRILRYTNTAFSYISVSQNTGIVYIPAYVPYTCGTETRISISRKSVLLNRDRNTGAHDNRIRTRELRIVPDTKMRFQGRGKTAMICDTGEKETKSIERDQIKRRKKGKRKNEKKTKKNTLGM